MQTAILFFIASSVGVSVGWQPMPDGSPRYEYVVQLDRELVAILKQGESNEGESIPISSEVPDDIHPIARIRIVVGDENLPRQKLVTQFKPWPEGQMRDSQSREGLVETQHVVPSDAANIAPRHEIQPILPAESSSQQILPPRGEILPPQNNGRYVEPIQNANQNRGNQWRDTSASSQADILQLFGENSRGNLQPVDQRSIVTGNRYESSPSGSGPISPRPQPILPPTAGPRYPRLDEPMTADNSSDRNQSPPSELSSNGSPVAGTTGVVNAPWPAPERFEDAPLAQAWNTQNRTEDRPASQTTDDSHSPEWPKTETPDRTASDSQWPNSLSPTPEIRREMLDGPADAELRTASGGPVSPTPASFPQLAAQPTAVPPQSTVISQPQTAGPTGGSPSESVFPLLLAWVLLSGSGAGNLYLFWSYLDIRNKYRGLIRTAGRKLGRRSTEEDYEDYDE